MSELQSRFTKTILANSETFLVGEVARRGVFGLVPPGRATMYVSDQALDSIPRPVYLVVVPFDDPTDVSEVIEWNGLSLEVHAAVTRSVRGVEVCRVLVAG